MQIGYNELGIKPKRAVLYRNFHEISGKVYLIEISRDKKHVFFLLFENYEQPHSFIAEMLLEKIAMKLLQDNQNSFERFIGQFSVKFGKLQIAGYHTHSKSQHLSRRAEVKSIAEAPATQDKI